MTEMGVGCWLAETTPLTLDRERESEKVVSIECAYEGNTSQETAQDSHSRSIFRRVETVLSERL